ncbi:GntR family transcriptional regulator [Saccharothrix sp. Mg75]|uniref:GntR family transcriptional regulator n=1 Tax=Saccharothrix sp. Mg75 TaxID=3445357 RepID=UPI003EE8460F
MKYSGIAAELRRRIEAGGLPPGARVPSTRQVAAEFGVAAATAARALAELARQGVVRAEPRSGTVVAGPARAAAPPRTAQARATRARTAPARELTTDRVVRAAVAIADAEGLAALSMRGVAARLGVAAMTPYRYVTGKDELVLLMADAAYGERGYPADPPADWRARLELAGRTLWSLHRRHPWLASIGPITRPLPLPNLMVHAEFVLAALDTFDLDVHAMFDLHVLLFSYVQGIAVHLEREQQARGESGVDHEEWVESRMPALTAIRDTGGHPTFARVLTTLADVGYDLVLDDLFELGWASLLDGLALRYGRGQ